MINTKHTPEPWWIPTGYYTYIQGMSNGVNEGRMNKQHEILTVLGVNQVIADLRKK